MGQNAEQIQAERAAMTELMKTPGWRLLEEYLQNRLDGYRRRLEDKGPDQTEAEIKYLLGQIRELKQTLRFVRDRALEKEPPRKE